MPFMKATRRQSDTTFFAESAESAESAKPIFANRGVKDVRVSLDQYPTNIQRISNLYLTPNRYFTRFAAVFALVFVLGVGNVWGETSLNFTSLCSANETPSSKSVSPITVTFDNSNATNPAKYYSNGTALRLYSGGKITFSSNSGNITRIVFASNSSTVFSASTASANGGTFTSSTWTGSASSITFTVSSSCRISTATVTTAVATDPSITTSVSSLTEIGYSITDFSQQVKSFTVSGTNLTGNVTVQAPTNYEVCKTSGGTYTSSVTFDKGSGTLSAQTVYVRLASGKAAGNYSGNVACTSDGATTKNVAVSGSVPFTVTWKANGTTHATTYVAYATGAGTALGSLPDDPNPSDYTCSPKAFYGWYDGSSYSHASTAPSVISTSTKITSDKTYNAVFATVEEGGTMDPITETLTVGSNGGTWPSNGNKMSSAQVGDVIFTALGSGTNDSKYYTSDNSWRFYTNTTSGVKVSVPNGGIITSVQVTWKTTIPATPSNWSRNQATSPTTYTPNSGTEVNEVSFTKTSSGNVFFQGIKVTYTPAGSAPTYSNYATSCCTPLAQVNGSANLSQWNAGVHIY